MEFLLYSVSIARHGSGDTGCLEVDAFWLALKSMVQMDSPNNDGSLSSVHTTKRHCSLRMRAGQDHLSMHAIGLTKFLKVNESKVTVVAGKRSRAPHFGHCEHEEQVQVRRGSCQQVVGARGRHGEEAQTKDDREIMPMRTLHARTTSLAMLCGDGICECDILAPSLCRCVSFLKGSRSIEHGKHTAEQFGPADSLPTFPSAYPCGTTKFFSLNAVSSASGAEIMWMKLCFVLTCGPSLGQRRSTRPHQK